MSDDECKKLLKCMRNCVKKYDGTFRCRKEINLYYEKCDKKMKENK